MITARREGKIKVCHHMKLNYDVLMKLNGDTFSHGSVLHG